MDELVLKAALAGLLHDVGKVEQRAKDDPWNPPDDVRDSGQPVHAAWTLRVAGLAPEDYRAALLAGGYHHQPERSPAKDKFLSKLIALADKLSAGERSDEAKEYKGKNPPQQLLSVFDRVSLKGAARSFEHFLPLEPLSLGALKGYIESEKRVRTNARDRYDELRLAIEDAVKQNISNGETYLENILATMQQYAWCVPSAFYHSTPDVSLYDHSRMTAALAVCMARFDEGQIDGLLTAAREAFKKEGAKPLPDTPVALLIGGDISGIQKFIYTITSKEAAKTLRGRSFYLQLLTEAVLRFVLNDLGLPYTNVIYSGGGHFFLLAPVSAKKKLSRLQREITERMLVHHGTSLYFALGGSEVPASGFAAGKFPVYWSKMHEDLGKAKTSRYTELDDAMYEKIFAVPKEGGNPDSACSVCGGDSLQTETFTDYDEAQARICSLCTSFSKEIGGDLTHAQFVALGWQNPQDTKAGKASDALKAFGLQFELLENETKPTTLSGVDRITFWAFDDPKKYPKSDIAPASAFLRYVVKDIPDMTFDDLQKKVEGGFKWLGVLRMDVDNLGDVFKNGLGKYATLARISTLSFQMSLFFEGWIKRICEEPNFAGKIYAVYAGGDDVFLIGPWDVMPELALQIRDDFAKYTADHEDLHISAGLAFIGGKYPIYQAAEDAEDAVNAAKRKNGKDFKDAFHFIGNTWKWNEFIEVKKKFERIVNIVDKLNGPHAIIQILRELAEMKAQKSTNGKEIWGPWQWRGAYLLKRMEERAKGTPNLAGEIQKIRAELEPDYAQINQWGAAARWAQLKSRKKIDNNENAE